MALVFILQAAANYLALRAQSSPNYNGVMLNTGEGWNQLMDMMTRVSQLAIAGKDKPAATTTTAKKSAKK